MATSMLMGDNPFRFDAPAGPSVPPPHDLPDACTLMNLFGGVKCARPHPDWDFCAAEEYGYACRNHLPGFCAYVDLFRRQPGYQRQAWRALPEDWREELVTRLPGKFRADSETGPVVFALVWAHLAWQARRALARSLGLRERLRDLGRDAAPVLALLPPAWFPRHAIAARRLNERVFAARADERRRIMNPLTHPGKLPPYLRWDSVKERKELIATGWRTTAYVAARFADLGVDHASTAAPTRHRMWEWTFRPMVGMLLRHVPGGRGRKGEALSPHFRARAACERADVIAREVLGDVWPGSQETIRHMVRDGRWSVYAPTKPIGDHLRLAFGIGRFL